MEAIACPYCGVRDDEPWAHERGFTTVRCRPCGFLYLNPRPNAEAIDAAVRTGMHGEVAQNLNVVARRRRAKIIQYRDVFARLFDDVWKRGEPVSWLDVGAGYGEIVEAVTSLVPPGSSVEGVEPMAPKASQARARGLNVTQGYLQSNHAKVDIVSMIDVFSHIPSFGTFLLDVRNVLKPTGEVFMETGNLADLDRREDFPGELGLPDHLAFAGEAHLLGFLERAGFELVRIEKVRVDGVINTAKSIAKKILGRPVLLRMPYSSRYRQLLIRARLS